MIYFSLISLLHVIVSFQFAPSSYGQPQMTVNVSAGTQYQPLSQMHTSSNSAGGQTGLSGSQNSVSVAPLQQAHEQPAITTTPVPVRTFFFPKKIVSLSCSMFIICYYFKCHFQKIS